MRAREPASLKTFPGARARRLLWRASAHTRESETDIQRFFLRPRIFTAARLIRFFFLCRGGWGEISRWARGQVSRERSEIYYAGLEPADKKGPGGDFREDYGCCGGLLRVRGRRRSMLMYYEGEGRGDF